jgi:hypothetical protein
MIKQFKKTLISHKNKRRVHVFPASDVNKGAVPFQRDDSSQKSLESTSANSEKTLAEPPASSTKEYQSSSSSTQSHHAGNMNGAASATQKDPFPNSQTDNTASNAPVNTLEKSRDDLKISEIEEPFVTVTYDVNDETTVDFYIPERYKVKGLIGYGGFGVVLGVTDGEANKELAVKKIGDAFRDEVDSTRMLREVKVMRLVKHPNLLSMSHLYMHGEDVYITSSRMETNLKRVIDRDLRQLSTQHVKYIAFQILAGLKYLHACGLLHRYAETV